MKKFIYIFIIFIVISCSGENISNKNTTDQSSGPSSPLNNANKEIDKLGESVTKKDELLESITQELASSNNSVELLNNSLDELKLQFRDLSTQNLSLIDEIKNLMEEKLLLEMSVKNLRTQYEAAVIEKSVESNSSQNQPQPELPQPELPQPELPQPELPQPELPQNNEKSNDLDTSGLTIKIGGKNEGTPYLSSSVTDFNNLNPDSKIELDIVDDVFKSFRDGEIHIAIDEKWFPLDDSDDQIADRKRQLSENNVDYIEIPITYYAISIIVNKSNNWTGCLYADQISDIFRRDFKYVNWQQVHPTFPNMPISLYGVSTDKELPKKFKEQWHNDPKEFRAYSPKGTDLETINAISKVPGSIGFIKFENYDAKVTALDLTYWSKNKSDGTTEPIFDKCLGSKMETFEEDYSAFPFLYNNILYVNKNIANNLTYAYLKHYLNNAESYTFSSLVDLDELHTPYYSFYYESVIEKLLKERSQ